MNLPLAGFPIVSTRDPDEAQSILSRELTEARLQKVRNRRSFRLDMNGVHLGRTAIGYNQFGADTSVDVGHVESALIVVMGVGPASIFHLDGDPVVSTKRVAVISPSRRLSINRPAGGGTFFLRAGFDAIEELFREVTGRNPRKPLVFDRSVDPAAGLGAQVRRLLHFLVDSLQRDGAVLENPLLRAGLDEMLLNALLALPNNCSDELMGDRRVSIAPNLVRRAEEFLDAHATRPITISEVVAQCGCSRATLFAAFRRFRGYTPMQFLADCRLRSAHEALQSPSPSDTVALIAYACGFAHLGRFSQAYRRRFGEKPSETLHQARMRLGL